MKKELRKKYLALRNSKGVNELKQASINIIKNLYSLDEFLNARTIMVYVSFGGEVETKDLIKRLLEAGKRVCTPLCNAKDVSLTAKEITNFSDLKPGSYGILEPLETSCVVAKNEIDFILVPGCVFSKDGHRIGYGKGYYDRFLKDSSAVTCGLCYDFCLLDSLPFENTDVPLDIIITEKDIIKTHDA